jgi:hypothetical protein
MLEATAVMRHDVDADNLFRPEFDKRSAILAIGTANNEDAFPARNKMLSSLLSVDDVIIRLRRKCAEIAYPATNGMIDAREHGDVYPP